MAFPWGLGRSFVLPSFLHPLWINNVASWATGALGGREAAVHGPPPWRFVFPPPPLLTTEERKSLSFLLFAFPFRRGPRGMGRSLLRAVINK